MNSPCPYCGGDQTHEGTFGQFDFRWRCVPCDKSWKPAFQSMARYDCADGLCVHKTVEGRHN